MEIPGAMGGSQGAWSHILHRVSKGGLPEHEEGTFSMGLLATPPMCGKVEDPGQDPRAAS